MANDYTTKVPLGAGTLVRKWYCDINSNTYAAPTWVGVFGVEDFKPALDPSVQDDSDYDSLGYKSSTITALGWTLELKLARKVTAASATVYDPGQELLRAAAETMGASNRVDVRWYEMGSATGVGPKIEAYRGYAAVSWSEDGGGMDALDTVSVTLTGQGARTAITHPAGALVAPVLYSVTPATGAAAGGTLVCIKGYGFMTAGVSVVVASGVKLAAHVAPFFTVVDNETLWATMPAEDAGTTTITVENSIGVSNAINFVTTA